MQECHLSLEGHEGSVLSPGATTQGHAQGKAWSFQNLRQGNDGQTTCHWLPQFAPFRSLGVFRVPPPKATAPVKWPHPRGPHFLFLETTPLSSRHRRHRLASPVVCIDSVVFTPLLPSKASLD